MNTVASMSALGRRATIRLLLVAFVVLTTWGCSQPTASSPRASGAPEAPGPAPGPAASPAPAPERVRLAYSSIAGVTAIPLIARDRGFFAENALDAELVYVASGTTAIQSLLGGELSFVLGGTEAVLNADAAGAELKVFAGLVDTVPFSLLVRPELTRPEDLRGKRVGITRLGSATDYALRAALKGWGLEAERDVAVMQMGGIPEIRAGLENGAIAGGTLSLPVLAQARRAGFRELADLAALDIDYQTTSVAATGQFLREHPTAATRLVRALSQAIHVIKTDRPSTLATFRALIQEDDEQILEETYERYGGTYIQKIPAPRRAAIAAVQQQMAASDPRVAALRLDDVIDERPVRDLEAEGFFARLYGEQ